MHSRAVKINPDSVFGTHHVCISLNVLTKKCLVVFFDPHTNFAMCLVLLTCTTTKIVKPKVRAIKTKLGPGGPKATHDAHPKKLRSRLPRNSASSARHMLLFLDFSSLIPRVSSNLPMVNYLKVKKDHQHDGMCYKH